MEKIKIIIADDHPMVVDGLSNYFKDSAQIEVVATTNSIQDIPKLVANFSPNILLVDYHFANQKQTGLDMCRIITTDFPCTKVLVISSFTDVILIKDFLEAGASGYLFKTSGKQEYIDAILTVFAGGESFGRDVRDLLVKERLQQKNMQQVRFTKTEKDILKLIIQGDSTSEIAKKLFREKTTIDSHRKSILSKLQLMDSENPKPSKNIMYYVNKFDVEKRLDCI